jgi:hypothetical protein
LRALPAACFFDLERWTDEPSTATRAVRFGGAIPEGYRGVRPAESYPGDPQDLGDSPVFRRGAELASAQQ